MKTGSGSIVLPDLQQGWGHMPAQTLGNSTAWFPPEWQQDPGAVCNPPGTFFPPSGIFFHSKGHSHATGNSAFGQRQHPG